MVWLERVRIQLALVAGIGVATLGICYSNSVLELGTALQGESGSVGSLPDGKVLHVLSLGFERLVADLFWLRTVYYVGTDAAAHAHYPDAERLAHLVTPIPGSMRTARARLVSGPAM